MNMIARDLLSADTTPPRLLDDTERGTIVEKLTEETPRDWSHFREPISVCIGCTVKQCRLAFQHKDR
ncbi:hypothetical protein M0R45_026747 [Rubus argutus]|uniref:Uncharacterized protein n=1 Tax=Rubus argutus TaxID=59490 RepID=A0AAW1X1W8_RUBAR